MRWFVQLVLGAGAMLALAMAQAEEWRLAKEEAGIQVFLRRIPGSGYQAYRGVVTLKTDMARLLALQRDVAGSCAWIHACREQKLLGHEGEQYWIYTRFDTPWPVAPRDSVLRVTTRHGADGSVTRILHGIAGYLPPQPGYVRVSKVEGRWTLTPKAGGEVEVVYQVYIEPGGSVPPWLANSFVVDAPYNTLFALRRLAEQR